MPKYNVDNPTTDLSPKDTRVSKSAMAMPSLKIQSGRIYEESSKELRFPQSIKTFQRMQLEPTIASALSLVELLVSRVPWEVKVPKKASEEEKARAKSINWNMANMRRPFKDYIIEFLGYLCYGFQPIEKVWEKTEHKDFEGTYKLKDFRSLSPSTVGKWIYNIDTGNLAGIRQNLSAFPSDFKRATKWMKKGSNNDIPISKLMLFRYNTKLDSPEGTSPLRSCYVPWKQKILVEDYELIGVAKDLGGIPHLEVDVEYLAKSSVVGSNEETVLTEMKRQAANLQAGEQAYVMSPIAYTDTGKELFKFSLLDGNNSTNSQTDVIIKRNENKMLMAFLADVLKLGTESQGSYALADSKSSLLAMGIEHHLDIIKNVLNHDLMKQFYKFNSWEYEEGMSATFEYGDIEKPDLDEFGKAVQRFMSVGAVRPTKELEDKLIGLLDVEVQDEADMNFIETESESRAGEGQGTSGTGNSQQGGKSSSTNSDNAA